jgi:hypothetical protein
MSITESSAEGLSRRDFLAGAAAAATAAASGGVLAQSASVERIPIIDAHIHLFDNTRPLGAGYMGSKEYRALNKPSTPAMYSAIAKPLGVVGAIVVESSPLIDDNLYYLEVCGADPFMVGVSGNLNPDEADFGRYVTHFHKDPLFRAIRASHFFTTENDKVALKPDNVANLKLLAQADLALDTANPSMELMQANVLLADAIPELRIIMDHLRSELGQPGGLRGGGEGDGGAAQHVRQADRSLSPAYHRQFHRQGLRISARSARAPVRRVRRGSRDLRYRLSEQLRCSDHP